MKAKLLKYSTKGLTTSKRTTISKRLNGYIDKSNKAQYLYHREGLIKTIPHIKVSSNTFIIKSKDFKKVKEAIQKSGGKITSWDITIKDF